MADAQTPSEAPGMLFQAYLEKGDIRLQTCTTCSKQIFFPRTVCPHCGSDRLEWRPISGKASVYSSTIVRQKPERGGDYNVAIVELAEGARLLTRVEGVPPAEVRIGMPVQAAIGQAADTRFIVFKASGAVRS
jgi:uncharacterized OB-fold protein